VDIGVVFPRLEFLGGAERVALEFMRRWQKDHDITLYALRVDRGLLEEFGVDVEVVECGRVFPRIFSNTLSLMLSCRTMKSSIGVHDAFFLNNFPAHMVDVHPNVWFAQEPARILYDMSQDALGDLPAALRFFAGGLLKIMRFLDRRWNRADSVLVNSKFSKGYVDRVYGIDSKVMYLGAGQHSNPRFSGDYVLCVGRLFEYKRVDIAIKAVEGAGIALKVVGEGPDRERLEGMAADNVEFLGRVGEKDMLEVYRNALCTVFTPIREPFGLVPLESMAAGTPVIGCREGGFTELIEDGVDGFLVDAKPAAVRDRIMLLSGDRSLLECMGRAAWVKAGGFTWDDSARGVLGELEGACGR
jgi:glycosyltransferase involved in cell wall biosynthesis